MAGIKIVDLPALGRDLAATDLLELSLAGGTGSRKITGQEIINASKLNVGTTPIINGTAGRLLFQSSGNVLQQSGNLFWDNTNGRLGIGTSTAPSGSVYIDNSGNDVKQHLVLKNSDAGSGAQVHLDLHNNVAGSSYSSGASLFLCSSTHAAPYASALGFWNYLNGPIALATNSAERMRVAASGNVLINTTTDAGFKLDVNGTARIKGTGTTSSTTALTVQNSAGTTYFSIKDDGALSSSGTDTGIYSNFTTGNKSPLLFSHSGYGTNTPNDTRIDFGYRGRQAGGLNSYDFFTYKVYQGADPTVTTGFEFYTHQNQTSSLASQLAMAINGSNVGIGTSSPFGKFDVKNGEIFVTTSIDANLRSRLTYQGLYVSRSGDGTYPENIISTSSAWLYNSRNSHTFFRDGVIFLSIGALQSTAGININTNGNVLINTATDAGYRLDVNGTARVNGELRAGNLQILTSGSAGQTGQGIVVTGTDTTFQFNGSGGSAAVDMFQFRNWGGTTATAQPVNVDKSVIRIYGGFNSGNVSNLSGNTLSITPTYNLTGSATIVRGVYYNPTLTSLTNGTHFAFHSTSGRVRFEGLPTSPTGLNAGDLWNDAGTLKIV